MAKKRKKKEIKKQERLQAQKVARSTPKILSYLFLAGLCLLIFYPPYFRALFFTKELLPTHLFSLFLFGLWWAVKGFKNDSKFVSSPLDYFVLGFVGVYLLSFFVAVNYRAALEEFLKVGNYFIIFYLVSRLAENQDYLRIILKTLSLGALGVALVGIGAAAGSWEVNGAYVSGRIHSTIQYPNSLGAYLTAAYMLLQTLFLTEARGGYRKYLKYFYPAAACVLLITIVFTQSRGTWLILFPVMLFSLILTPGKNRLEALSFQLVTVVPAVLAVPGMGNAFQSGGSAAWLWLAAGAVLSVSAYLLLQGLSLLPGQAKLVISALIILVFLGVGTYSINNLLNKTLMLSTPVEAQEATKSMINQVSDIIPGEDYSLQFKIKAEEAEEQPYAWMIDVTGINDKGTAERLVRESGGQTADWEEKTLTFQVPEDTDLLRVGLYNRFPGTAAEFDQMVLAGPGGTEYPVSFNLYKLLPTALARRISTFQMGSDIASSRLVFFKDSLKIIRDYPVLGLGGGGWKSIYMRYQSDGYFTTEVHNHFLQVWVETGTIGLLIFLGIWLTFFYTCYRIYFKQPSRHNRLLAVGICLAALTLGIHSFYDFNLSLGAIGIFLWAVFGSARAVERMQFPESEEDRTKEKEVNNRLTSIITLSVVAVLFIFVSCLYISSSALQSAQQKLAEERIEEAAVSLEKSIKWDPFAVDPRMQLGEIYHMAGNQLGDIQSLNRAYELYRASYKYDKYNPWITNRLGMLAFNMGEIEEGLLYLQKTIENQPYDESHYLYLSQAYYSAAQHLKEDDEEKARDYLNKVLELEAVMLQYHEEADILDLYLGKSHFQLGNYREAVNRLEQVKDEESLGEAYLFLALAYEELGSSEEAGNCLEKVKELDETLLDSLEEIYFFNNT